MMRLNLSRRLREVGDVEQARARGRKELENTSLHRTTSSKARKMLVQYPATSAGLIACRLPKDED